MTQFKLTLNELYLMDFLQIFSFFASSVDLNGGRYVSISFAFFLLYIFLISEVELRAGRTHEVVVGLAALCVAIHCHSSFTTYIAALAKTIHNMFRLYELHINNEHAPLETHGVSLTILAILV